MEEAPGESQTSGSGMLGSLKLIAAIVVFLLAILGILMAFGVVQPAAFGEVAVQLLVGAGVLVLASVLVGLLIYPRKQ